MHTPEDVSELLKACRNAVALLRIAEGQHGKTYPETLDLEIATENAEPVHDGNRETGSALVWADAQATPLLVQAARAGLELIQRLQAEDIAETEEWDALPYPEADRLDLALIPFAEVNQ